VSFANAGTYTVMVTNQAGSLSSSAANVVVFEPVAITAQPVSTTVNPDATASFSVSATFAVEPVETGTLTYKWFRNGVAVTSGTSAVLNFASVSSINAGTYTCQVHNSASLGGSLTSSAAVLAVNTPPSVSGVPASKVVIAGGTLSITPSTSGTEPLTYQWRKNGQPIPGQTTKTLTITNVQAADQAEYDVVVNNITNLPATSSRAQLTVVDPVVIVTPPASKAVAAGGILQLSVAAAGTEPITYQWYKDGAPLFLATADNYFVPFTSTADAGRYNVIARNEAASVTSAAADVTVQTPVLITVQPSSGTVVLGGSYTLGVTATGTGPIAYQWLKDGNPVAGATGPVYSARGGQRPVQRGGRQRGQFLHKHARDFDRFEPVIHHDAARFPDGYQRHGCEP
jgi:hypothetical protein